MLTTRQATTSHHLHWSRSCATHARREFSAPSSGADSTRNAALDTHYGQRRRATRAPPAFLLQSALDFLNGQRWQAIGIDIGIDIGNNQHQRPRHEYTTFHSTRRDRVTDESDPARHDRPTSTGRIDFQRCSAIIIIGRTPYALQRRYNCIVEGTSLNPLTGRHACTAARRPQACYD
jgi:hypothetical protein